MPGKRVQIDDDMWASLSTLAKDRMMSFQELFEEGMRDLIKEARHPGEPERSMELKRSATEERKKRRVASSIMPG
jgi:hypothetical protein